MQATRGLWGPENPPESMTTAPTLYGWHNAQSSCAHTYILPVLLTTVRQALGEPPGTVVDIGCGNGFIASRVASLGYRVSGIDASADGIEIGRRAYPGVDFHQCSVDDQRIESLLPEQVDCIISIEVIEHLLYPSHLLEQAYRLLKPGGHLILSTPYHGYAKNLALSLLNHWDSHFDVGWNGGHVKFFSKKSLGRLALCAGFQNLAFKGVGRVPYLWKSMIMVGSK